MLKNKKEKAGFSGIFIYAMGIIQCSFITILSSCPYLRN